MNEQTVIEMVIEEAAKLGVTLTPKEADWVAWEKTGFPVFFSPGPGETNVDVMRRQVREWVNHGCPDLGSPVNPVKGTP